MKRTIIAVAVLMSTSVFAAPSPSAYDRIQDGRIDGLSSDIYQNDLYNKAQDKEIEANAKALGSLSGQIGQAHMLVQANKDAVDKVFTQTQLNSAGIQTNAKSIQSIQQQVASGAFNGKDGKDGLNGKDGKDGTNGVDGRDGINGTNGIDGAPGANGLDGKDGKDGVDGNDGAAGAKGDKGDVGATGSAGRDGRDGKDVDPAFVQRANKQFADLRDQVNDNKRKANAGASTALAAAGIPQVMADQTFGVGAAVGGYEGESAIAVGFSARASHNVVIKASVGADSQQGFGYNAGVMVGW